jgi:2-dehydropantoate 2-reductase
VRIAVFGVGGVGGYFGGRLARGGQDVVWVARGETLRALRQRGLEVASPGGDFQLPPPLPASADPAELGPVDAVLLAVKAWQVEEAAESLPPLLAGGGFVAPLQNGVEAAESLAAALGRERVVGGLCRIISEIEAPGRIRHTGGEPSVTLGELDNAPSARTAALRDAFRAAGVRAEIPPDIHAARWEKFLAIASASAVGAATRAPIGVVRSLPETRDLLVRAMEEVRGVALARGVMLDGAVLGRTLDFVDRLPPHGTASMQRDLAAGRPSELEAQSGAVVRLGREAGVPTPVHEMLYAMLLPQERRARGAVSF